MGELDAIKRKQLDAAIDAAEIWADHVLGRAQRLAPIAEGTLRGSGERVTHRTDSGAEIVITFSTVYAARQHEELDWQHPRGGQAKYLEEPFKSEMPRLEPLVAAAAARAVA